MEFTFTSKASSLTEHCYVAPCTFACGFCHHFCFHCFWPGVLDLWIMIRCRIQLSFWLHRCFLICCHVSYCTCLLGWSFVMIYVNSRVLNPSKVFLSHFGFCWLYFLLPFFTNPQYEQQETLSFSFESDSFVFFNRFLEWRKSSQNVCSEIWYTGEVVVEESIPWQFSFLSSSYL